MRARFAGLGWTLVGLCSACAGHEVIKASPSASPTQTEAAASIELEVFREDPTMGDENSRLLRVGTVSLGQPEVVRLGPCGGADPTYVPYLVKLDFTINPPLDGMAYESAALALGFAQPRVKVQDVIPRGRILKKNVTTRYEVSPSFTFRDLAVETGSVSHEVELTQLVPIVTVYGVGESEVRWAFKGENGDEQGGVDGSTSVAMTVMVPSRLRALTVRLQYVLDMRYRFMGSIRNHEVRTDTHTFIWHLPLSCTES